MDRKESARMRRGILTAAAVVLIAVLAVTAFALGMRAAKAQVTIDELTDKVTALEEEIEELKAEADAGTQDASDDAADASDDQEGNADAADPAGSGNDASGGDAAQADDKDAAAAGEADAGDSGQQSASGTETGDGTQEGQSGDSGQDSSQPVSGDAASYQSIYPDMYATAVFDPVRTPGTVFLTFDDGPSSLTDGILDTLDAYGVKATFFVVGNQVASHPETLKRAAESGHTIGVHTTSHSYKDIYASVEAYLTDFYITWDKVHEITGVYPQVFRFPGGSVNTYNKDVCVDIVNEMTRRGFVYYDWNVSAGDAAGNHTVESVLAAATKGSLNNESVVLMHDTKEATAAALPSIIQSYADRGFTFSPITSGTRQVKFSLPQ